MTYHFPPILYYLLVSTYLSAVIICIWKHLQPALYLAFWLMPHNVIFHRSNSENWLIFIHAGPLRPISVIYQKNRCTIFGQMRFALVMMPGLVCTWANRCS